VPQIKFIGKKKQDENRRQLYSQMRRGRSQARIAVQVDRRGGWEKLVARVSRKPTQEHIDTTEENQAFYSYIRFDKHNYIVTSF
jgi:hypothetical protein